MEIEMDKEAKLLVELFVIRVRSGSIILQLNSIFLANNTNIISTAISNPFT